MICSKPLTLPNPAKFPDRPSQMVRGLPLPVRYDTIVVPCGKCMACIEKRQKDYAVRIRSEAEKRGTFCFVTLTYDDSHLPLVSTLWRLDKLTGEMERLTDPDFVCYSGREDFYGERERMHEVKATDKPRYIDNVLFQDRRYRYIARITPSVCRKDIQNWLKRCRVYFERKEGRTLDFSYSICSEYGPRFCRPHYHLALLGLTEDDARKMCDMWKLGFYKLDFVNRVNKDGSDGFGKVANYIAKYVSKGDFRCESEKDCTAFPCRQMNSKGLGNEIVDTFRNYALCFDMIGAPYDPDTFFCESAKRYLRRDEIASLVAEVPKRLAVTFDGKYYYAIPRLLRQKIFYVKKVYQDENSKEKTVYSRPSKLWRMVADSIRNQYAELDRQQFAQFCANKSAREIAESVASFNLESEIFAQYSDEVRKQNYQTRLQSSVF